VRISSLDCLYSKTATSTLRTIIDLKFLFVFLGFARKFYLKVNFDDAF
jgi:hypothetical protein